MLTPRVRARSLALGLTLIASTTVLAACSKPLATVTAFTGSHAETVQAQPRCVIAGSCRVQADKVVNITARAGGQIFLDVPKKLADTGWIVAAFTTDSTGKNTPVNGAGSQPVNGKHSVRLDVPLSTGGYILQVAPLPTARPNAQLSTWLIAVKLTQ